VYNPLYQYPEKQAPVNVVHAENRNEEDENQATSL
jgi:hypothetical protein